MKNQKRWKEEVGIIVMENGRFRIKALDASVQLWFRGSLEVYTYVKIFAYSFLNFDCII